MSRVRFQIWGFICLLSWNAQLEARLTPMKVSQSLLVQIFENLARTEPVLLLSNVLFNKPRYRLRIGSNSFGVATRMSFSEAWRQREAVSSSEAPRRFQTLFFPSRDLDQISNPNIYTERPILGREYLVCKPTVLAYQILFDRGKDWPYRLSISVQAPAMSHF
jgi:hypothetical protein